MATPPRSPLASHVAEACAALPRRPADFSTHRGEIRGRPRPCSREGLRRSVTAALSVALACLSLGAQLCPPTDEPFLALGQAPQVWPESPEKQRLCDQAERGIGPRPTSVLSAPREEDRGEERSEERRVGKECRSRWSP